MQFEQRLRKIRIRLPRRSESGYACVLNGRTRDFRSALRFSDSASRRPTGHHVRATLSHQNAGSWHTEIETLSPTKKTPHTAACGSISARRDSTSAKRQNQNCMELHAWTLASRVEQLPGGSLLGEKQNYSACYGALETRAAAGRLQAGLASRALQLTRQTLRISAWVCCIPSSWPAKSCRRCVS